MRVLVMPLIFFQRWMTTRRSYTTVSGQYRGGKVRLGGITRAGDEALRAILVNGATAVIHHARRSGKASPWLAELLRRKPPKLAAVALANKMARIAWKLMVSGETYSSQSGSALNGCAT